MKDILCIGGPMDGAVKTVNDECCVMFAREPQRPSIGEKTPTHRYIEVLYLDRLPYGVFRLDTMPAEEVLPRLLEFYVKGHCCA